MPSNENILTSITIPLPLQLKTVPTWFYGDSATEMHFSPRNPAAGVNSNAQHRMLCIVVTPTAEASIHAATSTNTFMYYRCYKSITLLSGPLAREFISFNRVMLEWLDLSMTFNNVLSNSGSEKGVLK